METDFKITAERVQGRVPVTVFHLEGRLDPSGAQVLEAQAHAAQADGAHHLLLDLKGVTAVTSAGLRAVLTIYKMLMPKDDLAALMRPPSGEPYKSPYLKLVNLRPEIYYIFNISGFLHNLVIYNNFEDALKSLG